MNQTIKIIKNAVGLNLEYSPAWSMDWVAKQIKEKGHFIISHTFFYQREELDNTILHSLLEDAEMFEEPLLLPFADKIGHYYKIPGHRLGILQDVYFEQTIPQTIKNYRAVRNVSIFKHIADLTKESIYIGGEASNAIPQSEFENIIKAVPNDYELKKYVSARISAVLRNYLDHSVDAVASYQKYLNKKPSRKSSRLLTEFAKYELDKFELIYDRLKKMLEDENEYSEFNWQEGIKDILLLIYPQYIKAFREAPIPAGQRKIRKVDFVLVNANGTVDLLEIKKPFDMAVVTAKTYRDNYIPLRDLSGCVMQLEKYLYFLTRSGIAGERKLQDKFNEQLSGDFQIRVTNPHGIVLIGRDNNLTQDQLLDFEVIRRKYKNIIDILTYDDLLRRLEAITTKFNGFG